MTLNFDQLASRTQNLGNLGGGSLFARIAAAPAVQSAEIAQNLWQLPKILANFAKIVETKRTQLSPRPPHPKQDACYIAI